MELYMTDAQLTAEVARCEFCEEKPCRDACPAHCSPADFIIAVKQGATEDIARAAGLIMSMNPLGGICGGICPDHHCQQACVHAGFDKPVEIPTIQAAIVARAKKLGIMPKLESAALNGKKVAVVGGGPAGIGAATVLAQKGYAVTIFEADTRTGGACALVPPHRLPPEVLRSDIEWALDNPNVSLETGRRIEDPVELIGDGFDGVIVAEGLHAPVRLGIRGEGIAVVGNVYLRHPEAYPADGPVAVVGGGAIALDCAVVAKLAGASVVEMIALENLAELPLTRKERQLLIDHDIEISCRTEVLDILDEAGKLSGVKTLKVALPAGKTFHPANIVEMDRTDMERSEFTMVIIAIGNRAKFGKFEHPAVISAGDGFTGPATVVEAVASGKNAAVQLDAQLAGTAAPQIEKHVKSTIVISGYNKIPVPLDTDFFGRTIPSPFLLSAAPPTDGYDQMKMALDAGWAGGIMKTAFAGIPIHIPADYMHAFDAQTYGNCDNVSGHSLQRVCREIERLAKEYPDRLIAGSTGGPVTGNDESDRAAWQSNMRMLEDAGSQAIEFSLSCPQGGDGTEGDIVSQSAALTARIVDWLMEAGRPDVPKLFKLTGAVTSIAVIVSAIKEVLDRYPGKKAGVTLANTFPTLGFRERLNGQGIWDEGVLVGMSGEGVAPISNLSIAAVGNLGVTISGNGGPMDYRAAAHFLALGARTVQFCTIAMKHGVHIVDELHSGLSFMLQARGLKSVEELIGCALPNPITDFMDLTPVKRISQGTDELCMSCGNCTRCSYHAISLDDDRHPVVDPEKCIGCSICTQKCFAGALHMRDRTQHELDVLVED